MFALLMPLAATVAAPAALGAAELELLRSVDLRLATIAHRLVTANAALCRDQAPATGAVLHATTQYDAATAPAAQAVFGFPAPVAIAAVVPDSPAARAGLAANDGVAAIGGAPLEGTAEPPSSADRDRALERIEASSSPVRLTIRRADGERTVAVDARPGCRARFEVLLGPDMTAHADARVVQIGVRFFERYRDEETAVVVAHELAHVILRHRARLEAAGVKRGLLGEIGRNARLAQRAETEADALSVALLHNAGFDAGSAAHFWRTRGGDIDGGLFRSRTHPATGRRVAALAAAAAAIAGAPRPHVPDVLAARDRPIAD